MRTRRRGALTVAREHKAYKDAYASPMPQDLLGTGDEFAIARVTALAEKYPNTREALSHVWMSHFPAKSRDAVTRILTGKSI